MWKMGFVTGTLPDFVDHRVTGLEGPVKNQGNVGTCTAMSLSSAMEHAIRKMGRQDNVSALHLWSKYAIGSMGIAGDQTVDEHIALDQTWPYSGAKACKLLREPFDSCGRAYGVSSGTGDMDPALQAERSSANAAGRYKVIAVERLQAKPANSQEIAAVIAGGDAVWASFWVDMDAWSHGGLRQGGVIPDYEQRDDSGHAVLLVGYRTTTGRREFLIHNSWGPTWGDGGYGWISEAMVTRHLRGAYKVRVSDANGPSPNVPKNNCPAGQVPDAVLGSCVAVCPSGSPPAAGVCLPSVPGLPGGVPVLPGLPLPFPIPGGPSPAPTGACQSGQVKDALTGQCAQPCSSGAAPIGGLCVPAPPANLPQMPNLPQVPNLPLPSLPK